MTMKPFEHTGFWWDPRHPETRWPGTLEFDPFTGATLSRTIPFHPSELVAERREFDLIHGETTGGQAVTLLNCFETGGTSIFANAVITGFHATGPDPPVVAAAAVIENLDEWWGERALARDPSLEHPHVGIRYVQPEPVEIHADTLTRTTIGSSPRARFEQRRIAIAEEIRIEIVAGVAQPLSLFQQRINTCRDFLSVAALAICNVEELTLCPPSEDGRPRHGNFYSVPVFKNPAERWPDFLFRHQDIASRVDAVFGAWVACAESLRVVRSLYMSGAYGESFLEIKFLALTQAAEAYHRRVYEGRDRYIDQGAYDRDVLPLLEGAIPGTLDPSHKQSLRSRIRYGNEFSFRQRMTMLFDEHDCALAAVIPSPRDWIPRIVDYRNTLTHHPVASERNDPDKLELVRINFVLRVLLELCFLKSMAMDAAAIKQLAKRCWRYRQIRRRFFE